MAKKRTKAKTKDRNKVNFSNPKTQMVISYLQIGENRITREEILQLAGKDIFYQLKKSGYIKEQDKGHFQGTKKLHTHVSKTEGKHFASSGSRDHALSVRKTLSLLPQGVLEKKHFASSFDVEKRFNKRVLNSPYYKEQLNQMQDTLKRELATLEATHSRFQNNSTNEGERYSEWISYQKHRANIFSELSYLQEDPYLIPDYQITLNEGEMSAYIQNLMDYRDFLTEGTKEHQIYTESIEKLQGLSFQGEITLSVEVVTDAYGNRELIKHRNFERFSNSPQIFLM